MNGRECDIEGGQSFVVGVFRPEDAPGIARLFRAVYGDEYPVKLVYDPEGIIDAFRAGENIPIVARTPKGDVVGHEAFYLSAASPRVYEMGQGVVHISYRKLGIMDAIHNYMYNEMAPAMDLDAGFGECVCNHVFMQKSIASVGHVPMALEVDLMPASAYSKEQSASGRVATLLMFRTYRVRPQAVYVPGPYADAFAYVYGALDDDRTLVAAQATAPPAEKTTDISVQLFDFAQVVRFGVHEAGEDFDATFAAHEKRALARGMLVSQVWLKLSWPWIGAVVDHLREKGYFFGGPLIQWFGEDGLLMQKVLVTPSWEGIHLYSERAEQIGEYVRNDWKDVNAIYG